MLRRNFLAGSSLAMGVAASGFASAAPIAAAKSILDYGALPDGKTLNTKSIQRAIDDAFKAGKAAHMDNRTRRIVRSTFPVTASRIANLVQTCRILAPR